MTEREAETVIIKIKSYYTLTFVLKFDSKCYRLLSGIILKTIHRSSGSHRIKISVAIDKQ